MISPLKIDPTRTTLLRQQFYNAIKSRLKWLQQEIVKLIVEEDAFGLNTTQGVIPFTANTRFIFETSAGKIRAFRSWLTQQINHGILQVVGGTDPQRPWTWQYIEPAYKKAITRAYAQATKASLLQSADFIRGQQFAFLNQAISGPVGLRQLEILATRSFNQLQGLTNAIATDLNRILADGFARGYDPKRIAREMVASIEGISRDRALTIARTEIVRAYAEGQLDALEALGIEEVIAIVEWITAGDDRVCPTCAQLNGIVLTIDQARGLIPLHPRCRCAWLPVVKMPSKRRLARSLERAAVI